MKDYEKLEVQAKMMRLVEGTDLKWEQCVKFEGMRGRWSGDVLLKEPIDKYEFALAIIEGKPVFERDDLYFNGRPQKAWAGICNLKLWSWNPPKPKTIKIEFTQDEFNLIRDMLGKAKASYIGVNLAFKMDTSND